jgi:hypothetical protein
MHDRYHITRGNRARRSLDGVLLSGFVATTAMDLAMFVPRVAGWPETDIPALLGSTLRNGEQALYNWDWWLGLSVHYLNGMVLLPLLFAYVFDRFLPGPRVVRGLIFSLGLWLAMQVVVLPALGLGFFARDIERPLVFEAIYLLGHVVYGLFLGGLGGAKGVLERRQELAVAPTQLIRLARWGGRKARTA